MRSVLSTLALLPAVALAHFQLQFPGPRGLFVAKNEPTYCDGYTTTTTNRTEFPLHGGFYSLHSGHPQWTFGVELANTGNPTSFDNFTTAVAFFPSSGVGTYCFPIDLSSSGIPNLVDGANVTFQFTYSGGDGSLYQCADVTLVSNYTIPSSVTCSNVTTPANTSSSASAPSGSPTTAQGNGALQSVATSYFLGVAGVIAVAVAIL